MIAVFRVDASLEIGTGHIMRCLVLAEVLRQNFVDVHFICRDFTGGLKHLIREKNFNLHLLSTLPYYNAQNKIKADSISQYENWLVVSVEQDVAQVTDILKGLKADWLIVDHYSLDVYWQTSLKPYYKELLVIDDLANRQHCADIILDQTYKREAQDYKDLVPNNARYLLGVDYVLLRPEFEQWRDYSLKRRALKNVSSILVMMGGLIKRIIQARFCLRLRTHLIASFVYPSF